MGRPPLEIGTAGKIRCNQDGDTWRARANFRGKDGKTRPIERQGRTGEEAVKRLEDAIKRISEQPHAGLTKSSRFRDLAPVWLKQVRARRQDTTADSYERTLNNMVLDRIGDLRLTELTVPTLEEVFDELHDEGYSANYRRSVRTVVRGPIGLAVRRGLIDTNPTRDLSPIEGRAKRVRALTPDERGALLDALDRLVLHDPNFKNSDVPAFVRIMLGTGVRIGEAVAIRWRDVNLTNDVRRVHDTVIPPRCIHINGNLVNVNGAGLQRHDGKTENADRVLAMPDFLVDMLTIASLDMPGPDGPILPGRGMTWRNPNNMRRSWRRARVAIKEHSRMDFDWVNPHVFRKTAATILDDSGQSARRVADLLGHADPSMTQRVYMGRGQSNPAAAEALDAAYSRRS